LFSIFSKRALEAQAALESMIVFSVKKERKKSFLAIAIMILSCQMNYITENKSF